MIQFKNKYFHFPSLIYIIYFLIILKILNYKIVWTIHNLKSHDGKFVYDKLAGILISKLVNAKIIHSNNNYEEIRKSVIILKIRMLSLTEIIFLYMRIQ